VGPLRALLEGCPHDDVLHFARFDASTFQDRPNDRYDHARCFEIIERATVRLGQPSPCGCYDYGFFHRRSPTMRCPGHTLSYAHILRRIATGIVRVNPLYPKNRWPPWREVVDLIAANGYGGCKSHHRAARPPQGEGQRWVKHGSLTRCAHRVARAG